MDERELSEFIAKTQDNWQRDLASWTYARAYGMEGVHPGTFSDYLSAALMPQISEWF